MLVIPIFIFFIMKVGVITPTVSKERKPFLDFLKSRMEKQTYQPAYWDIIDYPNTTGQIDIAKRYRKGIKKAFDNNCDLILLMEDDDYYPLNYIDEMKKAWVRVGKPSVIGVEPTIYYHLGCHGIRDHGFLLQHCSAFCTGVAAGVDVDVCADNEPFFDIALWKVNGGTKITLMNLPIGIKHGIGMCGGAYHSRSARFKKFDDCDQTWLRMHVDKEAFDFYKNIEL